MTGIKSTFSKGITAINVKTSTMLEQNKINTHIATLASDILALEKKVGHILWETWNEGTFSIEKVEEQLFLINEKKKEIEFQKARAEEVRREEQEILGTQSTQPQAAANSAFCSNCGASIIPNTKFCTKCGASLLK